MFYLLCVLADKIKPFSFMWHYTRLLWVFCWNRKEPWLKLQQVKHYLYSCPLRVVSAGITYIFAIIICYLSLLFKKKNTPMNQESLKTGKLLFEGWKWLMTSICLYFSQNFIFSPQRILMYWYQIILIIYISLFK